MITGDGVGIAIRAKLGNIDTINLSTDACKIGRNQIGDDGI